MDAISGEADKACSVCHHGCITHRIIQFNVESLEFKASPTWLDQRGVQYNVVGIQRKHILDIKLNPKALN